MSLLAELGEWLAERRPSDFVWSPATMYDPSDPRAPITIGLIPPHIDRGIGLAIAPMDLAQNIRVADEVPLQVKSRGLPEDPTSSEELLDAVIDELRAAHNLRLPGGSWLAVVRVGAGRAGWLGQDGNRRHQHVINARLFIGRQPT